MNPDQQTATHIRAMQMSPALTEENGRSLAGSESRGGEHGCSAKTKKITIFLHEHQRTSFTAEPRSYSTDQTKQSKLRT